MQPAPEYPCCDRDAEVDFTVAVLCPYSARDKFMWGLQCRLDKVLDQDPSRHTKIQHPFALEIFDIKKPMHQPSYNVLQEIEMLPFLQTSLPQISEILGERWLHLPSNRESNLSHDLYLDFFKLYKTCLM